MARISEPGIHFRANQTRQDLVSNAIFDIGRMGLDLANRLLRPLDRLASSSGAMEPRPLMIVGLPRSGTTLVYELLIQAFNVSYLTRLYSFTYGMPNLTTRLVASRIRNPHAQFASEYGRIPGRYTPAENAVFWGRWLPGSPELGHYVPEYSVSSDNCEDAATTLSSMSSITQRPYVFKNVYMTLALPAFLRLLPKSRAIVVTRNVESTIASVYRKRKFVVGWWGMRPPFARDVCDRSILEQSVFQCVRSRQLLEHALNSVSADRYRQIDYADLCTSPRTVIEEIDRWIGGDFETRSDAKIPNSFEISKGPCLSKESQVRIAEIAKPLHDSADDYIAATESRAAELFPE